MDEPKEVKSLLFTIELHPDGNVSVNCPVLNDTVFCLGLLEFAKAIVFQYKANQANIIKPRGGIMNFIKGGKRF